MIKRCPECSTCFSKDSPQWSRKIYCTEKCRKAAHKKKCAKATRLEQRRANLRQNEEMLYLVRQCRRAKTVQILTGHDLESFVATMNLVRTRPKSDVSLCHIAPVKGKLSIGLFHHQNLFYGGAYQNRVFGNKYMGGGLSISKKYLKEKWEVRKEMSTNEILLMVEEFLGDVIPKYLKVCPVRKSKKYQIVMKLAEIQPSINAELLMRFSYNQLVCRLDELQNTYSYKIEYEYESKFLNYIDELTRFAGYGGERAKMLRKLRGLMIIAYMVLEQVGESKTFSKNFYTKYERLVKSKYAFAVMSDPGKWSQFKDLAYATVFAVLQGASVDIVSFRKEMLSWLSIPKVSA